MAQKLETKLPLRKVLTISAETYCNNIGNDLTNYHLEGIFSLIENLGEVKVINAPKRTKVVVNARLYDNMQVMGTALILKDGSLVPKSR
ncbi:MAG: hypothetical protein Q8L29_03110 [archaeon]|nr:hypothetical protein [archaeon]